MKRTYKEVAKTPEEESAVGSAAGEQQTSNMQKPAPTFDSPQEALGIAEGLYQQGKLDQAIQVVEIAIQCCSKSKRHDESLAPLYHLYGTILLDQAEGDAAALLRAQQVLEDARDCCTPDLELLDQIYDSLANVYSASGRYLDAIAAYEKRLDVPLVGDSHTTRVARVHFCMAHVYMKLNATMPSVAEGGDKYQSKSLLQYLECAKTIEGIVETLCGVAAEQGKVAGFKMTGLDDDSDCKVAGLKTTGLDDAHEGKVAAGLKTTGLDDNDGKVAALKATGLADDEQDGKVAASLKTSGLDDDTKVVGYNGTGAKEAKSTCNLNDNPQTVVQEFEDLLTRVEDLTGPVLGNGGDEVMPLED